MAKLFLCHSSKDKPFVRKLALDLLDVKQEVFLSDWDIEVGRPIFHDIGRALSWCDYLLFIASRNSVKSSFASDEWQSKMMSRRSSDDYSIIPCLINKCKIPDLLKHLKYANFIQSYELGMTELLAGIYPKRNGSNGSHMPAPWGGPIVDYSIEGKFVNRKEPALGLLKSPAKRLVEVLVKAPDGAFYRQGAILPGEQSSRCTFGAVSTPDGARFEIYLITTFDPLPDQAIYTKLPLHQTLSKRINVILNRNHFSTCGRAARKRRR